MAVELEYIQFTGQLFDARNKTIPEYPLAIQFFNAHIGAWVALDGPVLAKKSVLVHTTPIPGRISKANQTVRVVREALKEGGVPSFRLVKAPVDGATTQVVATHFTVSFNRPKATLAIDFGRNWLLDKSLGASVGQLPIIALPLPLYKGVGGTVAQIEEGKLGALAERQPQGTAADTSADPKRHSDLALQIEEIEVEKARLQAQVKTLQNKAKQYTEALAAKDSDLAAKASQIAAMATDIEALQQQIEEIKDHNAAEHPNKLPASQVYKTMVEDVAKADKALARGTYKVANVSLNLKTTVEKGAEGAVFGLLDFESAKAINSAAISDISLDIVPNEAPQAGQSESVPNVTGMTETAARNVLLGYGLTLDPVYQATGLGGAIAGQSIKQVPAPNTPIVPGQAVTVIFAKPLK